MKFKIFSLSLLLSISFYTIADASVAADAPLTNDVEKDCQKQLQHFYALSESPKRVDIDGINTLGITQKEAKMLAETTSYCTAWEAVIDSFIRQHGEVLDAVEKITGMPTPNSD